MVAFAGILDPGEDGLGDTTVESVANIEMHLAVDGVIVGHGEVLGRI